MAKNITSSQNKIVKTLVGLKNKRNRDKEGLFVAEGIRFVSEIPKNWEIALFACSESFQAENDLATYEARAEVYVLTDAIFQTVADTENPQGILAVCKKKELDMAEILRKEKPFFLMAEDLNDPGNLGTIIRTAHAAGADGIFLSKGSVDLYNPKVLRSTMGSFFHIPIFQNIDLVQMAKELKDCHVSLYAAHLEGEAYPYALPLQEGCAFLIGNEARGLSEEAAKLCDKWVKIPMPGAAESLNASIAAGILLYEVVRQRI